MWLQAVAPPAAGADDRDRWAIGTGLYLGSASRLHITGAVRVRTRGNGVVDGFCIAS